MGRTNTILNKTEEVCQLFIATVEEAIAKIQEAERASIERIENYVPTTRTVQKKKVRL